MILFHGPLPTQTSVHRSFFLINQTIDHFLFSFFLTHISYKQRLGLESVVSCVIFPANVPPFKG